MLDNFLCKEIPPNIQSKLHLAQLETVSLYILSLHLRKYIDIHLTAASFQYVIESNKSPQRLVQTEQSLHNPGFQAAAKMLPITCLPPSVPWAHCYAS